MIHFRVADIDDIHEVSVLLAALFEEVEHSPDAEAIATIFSEVESSDHHSTLLALNEEDDIVGIITLEEGISFYAGGKFGAINELYVVAEYRSVGVGKMLIDEAKDLAESRGWKRLEVTTPGDEFAKTRRFYEREGFHKIGPRYKFEV